MKKGQVTIFIIVAVMVVALVVLIFFLFPGIRTSFGLSSESVEDNPSAFLQTCLEDKISETLNLVALQGGDLNPENYYLYQDNKLNYLCYTNKYYETCVVQQPLLKTHIEDEVAENIRLDANDCLNSLKENLERRGFGVSLSSGEIDIELLPQRVFVNFGNTLTINKDGAKTFDSLRVVVNNNLYELTSIAESIVGMEARYGDSETTIYMNYYRNLKVEKLKQNDGTTVYILTDRDTKDKLQFASRSLAWPPGYGVNEVLNE